MTGTLRTSVGVLTAAVVLATASTAGATSLTEFPTPGNVHPGSPVAGPDGNVWFTVASPAAVWQLTPAGQFHAFSGGLLPGASPYDMATGADGNLWVDDDGTTKAIDKVTPSGQITPETSPALTGNPQQITPGPGGDMYFFDVNTNSVGKITPSGQISEVALTTNATDAMKITFENLVVGPDNNLWVTDSGTPAILEGDSRGRRHRVHEPRTAGSADHQSSHLDHDWIGR